MPGTRNYQDKLDYSAYGAGLSFGFSGAAAPRFSAFVEGGVAKLDISADIPFSQAPPERKRISKATCYRFTGSCTPSRPVSSTETE